MYIFTVLKYINSFCERSMVVKALEINYIERIEIDVLFRLPWSCLCLKTCTPARTIGCPHILLPLDEQACGAINQTPHGRHILLSMGSFSASSSIS